MRLRPSKESKDIPEAHVLNVVLLIWLSASGTF